MCKNLRIRKVYWIVPSFYKDGAISKEYVINDAYVTRMHDGMDHRVSMQAKENAMNDIVGASVGEFI